MRGRSTVPYPISRWSNRHLIGSPLSDLVAGYSGIFSRDTVGDCLLLFGLRERERERKRKTEEECWFFGERFVGPRRASRPISDYEGRVENGGVVVWSEPRTTRCSEISWRTAAGFYLRRRGEWERDAGHAVHCARIMLWTRSCVPSLRFSETKFSRIYIRVLYFKNGIVSLS